MGVLSCLLRHLSLRRRDRRPLDSGFMERFPLLLHWERGWSRQQLLRVDFESLQGVFLIKWR